MAMFYLADTTVKVSFILFFVSSHATDFNCQVEQVETFNTKISYINRTKIQDLFQSGFVTDGIDGLRDRTVP